MESVAAGACRHVVAVQPVSTVHVELQPSPEDRVPVVALLLRELQPVTADGRARPAAAVRLDGARRRTAVVRDEVAVVDSSKPP